MSEGRFTTRWGRRRTSRHSPRHDVEAKLVSRLRALSGPTPEAGFRSDLRTQLVAITGRIVSESETAPAPASSTDEATTAARRRPLRSLRRPALALVGATTVLALLLGMAVWMSSGSLPGQSLYGVKRASENVQLSMAGGDEAKGQAYLQLAGNRVREAAKLLSHPSALPGRPDAAGGRVGPHTASLVSDTLASADDDTIHGMQLLGRSAVGQLSTDPLAKMLTWWPDQNNRMVEVRNRIPAGSLRNRAQASVSLLQRIATRTGQLSKALGCSCLSRANSDELGPVPCTSCAPVPTSGPGGSGTIPLPGVGSTTSGPLPSVSLPRLGGSPSTSSRPPRAAGRLPVHPPTVSASVLPADLGSATGVGLPAPVPSLSVPGLPVPSLSVPVPSLLAPVGSVAGQLLGDLAPVTGR